MCQVSSVWLSPIRNKIEGNFTPLKSKYEVKISRWKWVNNKDTFRDE